MSEMKADMLDGPVGRTFLRYSVPWALSMLQPVPPQWWTVFSWGVLPGQCHLPRSIWLSPHGVLFQAWASCL